MIKHLKLHVLSFMFLLIFSCASISYADTVYTVVKGDSMWKIAVKYEVGLSEIISANPHIKNPALIYPGDKLTIPQIDDVKAVENEVVPALK